MRQIPSRVVTRSLLPATTHAASRHLALSLALALAAVVPLLALAGCNDVQQAIYKAAIEKALHEDALTGTDPTPSHTAAMRQVDLTDCPQDFREAYINHIHAWDEMVKVRQAKAELDNEENAAAAAGVLATLFDSDQTPWSDHVRAEDQVTRLGLAAASDIHTTYLALEDIAAKYGAQVPH